MKVARPVWGGGKSRGVKTGVLPITITLANARLYEDGSISCNDLIVLGDKSRVSKTLNFGTRKLYCYEMPSPLFGDIGRATLDKNGVCYIYLDDIFYETINTECAYNVFLQKYGKGDLWVSELNQGYFVVTGSPGIEFAWEIKAKQFGTEMKRLNTFKQREEKEKKINYEIEAKRYLSKIEKEIFNYE